MNEFYDFYNRGVEKRDIFMEDKDYLRYIQDLHEFNDQNQVYKFGSSVVEFKKGL